MYLLLAPLTLIPHNRLRLGPGIARRSTRMCINCWHTSDDRHLSLLPFSAGDAMLPGEKRTLLLRDRKEMRLLERACKSDHMIFGQLLLYSNFFEDGREACVPSACVPLLQVCEIREPRDAGGVEGAIWTAVKCVGRARLETEPRVQPRGFLLSQASAVPDSWRAGGCQAGGGPAEDGCGLVAAQAESALLEVRSLQDTCRSLERELQAICGSAPPPGGSEARGAAKGRLGSTSLLSSTSRLGYGDASRYTRAPLGSRLDTEARRER